MPPDSDDPAEGLVSIAEAAKRIGVNKSTLSRQVKSGAVRSHDGKVRVFEVIEDRAKNVDHSKAHRRATPAASKAVASNKTAAVASRDASPDATTQGRPDATPPRRDATAPVDGDAWISIAAAAKAIGINKSTLSRQVKSGAVRSTDGKVRLSEVYDDRAKNIDLTKRSKTKRGEKPQETEADDLGQLEMVLVDGELLSFADAQRLKENYIARKHHLDYLTKSRAVVDRRAAEDAFFQVARQHRDAWTAWAPRISVLLAAEVGTDAALLAEGLSRHVHQHLVELGEPKCPAVLAPEPAVVADGQPDSSVAPGGDAASPSNG